MRERLVSLRARVILTMAIAASIGLFGLFAVVKTVELDSSRQIAHVQAVATVGVLGSVVSKGVNSSQLAALSKVLRRESVTIVASGSRPIHLGQTRAASSQPVIVNSRVGGTTLSVVGYPTPTTKISLEITAAAGLLMALMLASGLVVGTLLTSGIAGPVEQAAATADRVASGDLSARMGDVATPELRKLALAFDGMASRLEEADQQQRQFLSDLAHEIATPLNTVTGFALGLAEGHIASEADRLEAAELVAADTQRLHSLLGALRRLHQLDLAQPVEEVPFDVAAIVADIVYRLEPTAKKAGIKIVSKLKSATATGDPRLVDMTVENLVSNAIRYTPAHGRVDVMVAPRAGEVEVRVKDSGIGIAPEHLERIFDRLYRVDEARARATGGFGIGLALVRRAALALGGRVEVESQPGKGSEFRLILPESKEMRTQPGGSAPLAQPPKRPAVQP